MRAAANASFGLLIIAALITSAVQGQEKNPTADAPPQRSGRYAEFFAGQEPSLLAQTSDQPGPDRKMRSITPASASDNSTDDRPPPSPFGPPPAEIDRSDSSASPITSQKTSAAPGASSAAGSESTPGPSRALKAVQDRLSGLRKATGGPSPEARKAQTETAATPAPATAKVAAGPDPNEGLAPPAMPDLHDMLPANSAAAAPIAVRQPSSIVTVQSGGSVGLASAPAAPVVNGPVSSSRRAPLHIAALPKDSPRSAAPTTTGSPPAGSAGAGSPPPATTHGAAVSATPSAAAPSPAGTTAGRQLPAQPQATPIGSNVLFSRQSPLLGVETSGPRSIIIGKEAVYTVTLTNTSDVPAQDVVVSINIPNWTEVTGTKATNGAAQSAVDNSGEPLVWQLVRLEPRSKEQLVIRLVPRESRPFDLAVQWTYSPVNSKSTIEVREPKLSMSLAGPKEIFFGQTKVYKLTLVNLGTADAENVMLVLSPVDGSMAAPTEHEIGTIRAGDNKLVEIELSARQPGIMSLKAAAVADGNLRADVEHEILVRRAELKLAMTAPESKFAGTVATYTIKVTNPGNASAENVQLAAMLPAGAKYVASTGGQYVAEQNKVTWSLSALSAGAEEHLELHCELDTPGANRLQLLGTASNDLSDSMSAITNVEALADLKLEVSDPANPMALGDEVNYEVHIRNRGQKAAENVDVAVFFSQGVEPLSAQGAQHELSPGQVVFKPIASIAPGAEVVLKIKARGEVPGNHVFRAEVSCAAVGTKLASEETTLFYGGDTVRPAPRAAARPNPAVAPGATQANPEPSTTR